MTVSLCDYSFKFSIKYLLLQIIKKVFNIGNPLFLANLFCGLIPCVLWTTSYSDSFRL